VIVAVSAGAFLIGVGAVLSGIGALLTGLAALRAVKNKKENNEIAK
jgi:hypothetical protein